jgi:apolipoprotein D and lipocalin family protein
MKIARMKPRMLLFIALLSLTGCQSTRHLKAVDDFELNRYMGTWYEIARYPHHFEKGLSSVSAQYTVLLNGKVEVINHGFDEEKQAWKSIRGSAKAKDPTRGQLKVSFFKPFYATYKIIYLNETYTRAIVTGPTYNYLWILSRDPVIPPEEFRQLIDRARAAGFDPEKIIQVDQTKNRLP